MVFRILAIVLVLLGVVGAVLGYLSINEITVGPVFLGIGAMFAIFGRMAQAEYHQSQQLERLKAIHFMIRDEIDRASLVPGRGRDFSSAAHDEEESNV
jgi:hypothetical protein